MIVFSEKFTKEDFNKVKKFYQKEMKVDRKLFDAIIDYIDDPGLIDVKTSEHLMDSIMNGLNFYNDNDEIGLYDED